MWAAQQKHIKAAWRYKNRNQLLIILSGVMMGQAINSKTDIEAFLLLPPLSAWSGPELPPSDGMRAAYGKDTRRLGCLFLGSPLPWKGRRGDPKKRQKPCRCPSWTGITILLPPLTLQHSFSLLCLFRSCEGLKVGGIICRFPVMKRTPPDRL